MEDARRAGRHLQRAQHRRVHAPVHFIRACCCTRLTPARAHTAQNVLKIHSLPLFLCCSHGRPGGKERREFRPRNSASPRSGITFSNSGQAAPRAPLRTWFPSPAAPPPKWNGGFSRATCPGKPLLPSLVRPRRTRAFIFRPSEEIRGHFHCSTAFRLFGTGASAQPRTVTVKWV